MKRTATIVLFLLYMAVEATAGTRPGEKPRPFEGTRLKMNIPYALVGVANLSIETALGGHVTLNVDAVYSPWESIDNNKMKFFQLIPEVRWYPRHSFDGFYMGAFGAFDTYDMTKWNYLNRDRCQRGWGFCFGATAGYSIAASPRIGFDMFAGLGWHLGKYRGYNKSTGAQYVGFNGSGEFIPYKIGFSISYKLHK